MKIDFEDKISEVAARSHLDLNLDKENTLDPSHRFRTELSVVLSKILGQPDDYTSQLELLKLGHFNTSFPDQEVARNVFNDLNLKSIFLSVQNNEWELSWNAAPVTGISVISAIYNNDLKEFRAYLNSVLIAMKYLQTDCKELILIDDASENKNGLRKTLADYENSFQAAGIILKTGWNSENMGPAASRNKGAQMAQGKNLFFVDSDDLLHPLYFQILAQELDAGSLVVTPDMIFPNGRIFISKDLSFESTLVQNGNGSCIGLSRVNPLINEMVTSGTLYTSEKLNHYEDWELNLVLKGLGFSIVSIPIPLYYYRQTPTGRDSSAIRDKMRSRFACIGSSWDRLYEFQKKGFSVADFRYFKQSFRDLLLTCQSELYRGDLSKPLYRKKLLKLLAKIVARFIWPDQLPLVLMKLKLLYQKRNP